MKKILIVDDEVKILKVLSLGLKKHGFHVISSLNELEARKKIEKEEIDIVFLDYMLENITGIELLKEFKSLYPEKIFIIITAFGNIEQAVQAMKIGAFDYITKPAKINDIISVIEKATEYLYSKNENLNFNHEYNFSEESELIQIGRNHKIKSLYQTLHKISDKNVPILLQGEKGLLKNQFAKLIYEWSTIPSSDFISIECRELENQSPIDILNLPPQATLFLNHISDLSLTIQGQISQKLRERLDIRVISSSESILKSKLEKKEFREDLYYMLSIIELTIPPLRERKEDIPLLIDFFIKKWSSKNNKEYILSPTILQFLVNYSWDGNIRELERALYRVTLLSSDGYISMNHFPKEILNGEHQKLKESESTQKFDKNLMERMEEIEKNYIYKALEESHGNASQAAKKLGITRQLLLYKMNKYSIK